MFYWQMLANRSHTRRIYPETMDFKFTLICLALLTLNLRPAVSLRLGWIFGMNDPPEDPVAGSKIENGGSDVTSAASLMAKIPFELQSMDERFLRDAEKFTGLRLSELDACHHKIIFGLRKSCAELSEEEISKLSVNLLNCQSAVEGRHIFPCTHDMLLKECTKDMDKDTWNAYHIVSNRARAVCYGSRQTLFRTKTEMAVNMLVSSAEEQLSAMELLQKDQKKLGQATNEALDSVSVSHQSLMQQQDLLKAAQKNIQYHVASNIRDLAREKTLIATGQKNLEGMTQSIKDKLNEANVQLSTHHDKYKKSQEEVLSDLSEMHERATEVWKKIDNSTQKILAQHQETSQHYKETLERLRRVNESIGYLLQLVENTRTEVDAKLLWLSELAGGTGDRLEILFSVTLHLGFFILGAVTAAFVQAPFITRFSLLVIVPLNCVTEINMGKRLDFGALTTVMVMSAILHWMVKVLWRYFNKRESRDAQNAHLPPSFKSDQSPQEPLRELKNFMHDGSDSSEDEQLGTPEMDKSRTTILESVMASVRKTFCSTDGHEDNVVGVDQLIDRQSKIRTNLNFHYTNGSNLNSLDEEEEEQHTPESTNSRTQQASSMLQSVMQSVRKTLTSRNSKTTIGALEEEDENNMTSSEIDESLLDDDFIKEDPMDSTNFYPRLTRRSINRGSTPIRSESPNARRPCQGLSLKGQRCRLSTPYGKDYCHIHSIQMK